MAAALLAALAAWPAAAQQEPLPRFATLRSDEVNVRAGPGQPYPVEWVFVRQDLPVEIVAEYDNWRKIRDSHGDEGWVHRSLLSGRRGILVAGAEIVALRSEPRASAAAVARAEPGVLGRLLACPDPATAEGEWCYVDLDGYRGWLQRDQIWGVYPQEIIE